MISRENFQISLAAARVNAGMTQVQACERLGIAKTTLLNWENGHTIPGTVQLMALASLYGIDIDMLRVPEKTT